MIYIDADNTLWDTDAVYADSQLRMLERVENFVGKNASDTGRLDLVRELDQDIASIHHGGLKYPPAILAVSIALSLKGLSAKSAVNTALKQGTLAFPEFPADSIQASFLNDLKAFPELRPGVAQGLKKLSTLGEPIILLTEGHKARCEILLDHFGLACHFKSVMENRKTTSLYERLAKKGVTFSDPPIMIGDQLDRDVIPANHAGFITFYFPGGFAPKWTPHEGDANPDYKIVNFNQAAELIISLRSRPDNENPRTRYSSAATA